MRYIRDGNVANGERNVRSEYQCVQTTSRWEVAEDLDGLTVRRQGGRNSSERQKCNVIEVKNLTTRMRPPALQRDFAKVERIIEFLQAQFTLAAFQPTGISRIVFQ